MFQNRIAQLLIVGLLCVASGCAGEDPWKAKRAKTVTAKGVVTLDGKPLDAAQVVFAGVGEGVTGASGLTDAEGKFTLSAFPPDTGAIPGTYRVFIVKSNVPEVQEANEDVYTPPAVATILVPLKYTNPDTSGLQGEVPATGTETLKFDLVSK